MMWWHWSWYEWLLTSVAMITFWSTVVYLVAGALGRRRGEPIGRPDSPEAVLAQRLATGDIDDDEYRRRMATLAERSRR